MARAKRRARTSQESNHQPRTFERGLHTALRSGEILSVGVVNLVKNTLLTALSGARDVGGELASTGVSAVRGAIRASSEIGNDLGAVARGAIRGTIQAAEEIGSDLGTAAKTATRGAITATSEVGADVGRVARDAAAGTADAVSGVRAVLSAPRRPLARAGTAPPRRRRRTA